MSTMSNKTVLITGASSGIGAACAQHFARMGARLILTARRLEKLEALQAQLQTDDGVDVLCLPLDVRNQEQVNQTIQSLAPSWQAIDVLVNNAGLALSSDRVQDADTTNWETMIDTNLKGLLYVTHAVLPGMLARNTGHMINIGSIAGYEAYPGGNVYCASKAAVHTFTQGLKMDLLGTKIRVTEVAPGAVNTEFSTVRWQDKARADAFYQDFQPLLADDIADAVVYCASRPAHVNIREMVVFPTDQSSATLLNKSH